jgi:serine/threonine-protein phosphatase 6 regulatory ankyrin repeat subunit B
MNLIRASSKGDLAAVKKAMEDGPDVNATDVNGRTALFEASWCGHTEIVKLLLGKKANPNIADSSGYTALMRASEEGHASIVGLLLKSDADVNYRGKVKGTTALMLAAEQGHIPVIDLLIDGGAKINAIDQYEETALARAYKNNQLKAAEHLEKKGGRGKPERNSFTYSNKDARPITKATLPEWNAGSFDSSIDDDIVIGGVADESFDEE